MLGRFSSDFSLAGCIRGATRYDNDAKEASFKKSRRVMSRFEPIF
jgi:hypothetical protein